MKYLVIELEPKPFIRSKFISQIDGYEPIIFETKQDAFRAADRCKKGLVYPIIDIMKVLDKLKALTKKYDAETSDDFDLIHDILTELDEII